VAHTEEKQQPGYLVHPLHQEREKEMKKKKRRKKRAAVGGSRSVVLGVTRCGF
jgi:L-rhamnose isomerase